VRVIELYWLDLLRHMLGANPERKKQFHGFRNYFCAEVGSEDFEAMQKMKEAGLVTEGQKINDGKDQYFFATLEGCKSIGLHKAAIKRAFGR